MYFCFHDKVAHSMICSSQTSSSLCRRSIAPQQSIRAGAIVLRDRKKICNSTKHVSGHHTHRCSACRSSSSSSRQCTAAAVSGESIEATIADVLNANKITLQRPVSCYHPDCSPVRCFRWCKHCTPACGSAAHVHVACYRCVENV